MDFNTLPSILTPDPGLLLWMLAAFLVVFFVLAKFGFPAIIGMVDKRNNFINGSLKKAQEATTRLENIKQECEGILREAHEKQASILKDAAATRDAIVEDARMKARQESERILNNAKAEIESQKLAAISDIRKQVAKLSVEVSEKILRKQLGNSQEQAEYINLMLDEVVANDKQK